MIRPKRFITIGLILFLVATFIHFQKHLDFLGTSLFYLHDHWWLNEKSHGLFSILYEFPRYFAAFAFLIPLVWFVRSEIRRKKARVGLEVSESVSRSVSRPVSQSATDRFFPLFIMLGNGAYIGVVSLIKKYSGQLCPDAFIPYGGVVPVDTLYALGARCFPGGHATSGFVWMLLGVRSKRPWAWVLAGSLFGWTTGTYQTLRGLHFFSDTAASFGIILIFFGAMRIWLNRTFVQPPV